MAWVWASGEDLGFGFLDIKGGFNISNPAI